MSNPMLPPGTNRCRCPACGEYFTSPGAFDMHRAGEHGSRYCIHPSELTTKDGSPQMAKNKTGHWTRPYSGPHAT